MKMAGQWRFSRAKLLLCSGSYLNTRQKASDQDKDDQTNVPQRTYKTPEQGMSDSASHHSTVGEKDRQMEGSTGEGEWSGGPQTLLDRAEADIMFWQNKASTLEQEKNDLLKEAETAKQKERELEE